jgi:hypothetical protein
VEFHVATAHAHVLRVIVRVLKGNLEPELLNIEPDGSRTSRAGRTGITSLSSGRLGMCDDGTVVHWMGARTRPRVRTDYGSRTI